jgi:hypothetical protein
MYWLSKFIKILVSVMTNIHRIHILTTNNLNLLLHKLELGKTKRFPAIHLCLKSCILSRGFATAKNYKF